MASIVRVLLGLGRFEAAFGGKVETVSLGIAISSADRRFRIGCDTVERAVAMDLGDAVLNIPIHQLATEKDEHGKNRRSSELIRREKIKKQIAHNPPYAAMIDVDAAQDDPEVIHPGDFRRDSFKQSWDRLKNAIG